MMSLLHHFLDADQKQDPIAALAWDIEDLLNHTRSSQPWSNSQGSSLLNYGLPSWVGKPMTPQFINELASQIKQALLLFEPRIDEKTLHVLADPKFISSLGIYKIEIHGMLRKTNDLNLSNDKEIDWFIHIDPHYGVAKIQATTPLISIAQ